MIGAPPRPPARDRGAAPAGQGRPSAQAAEPTALHPALARPADGPERAAAGWTIGAQAAAADDPLLACLVLLGELLERPTSAERADGRPAARGRPPDACSGVARGARAGLAARLVRRPLERISDLTLPCILLLEGRDACVLVARWRASGRSSPCPRPAAASELPLADLAARYSGHALFARPELRLDRQAEQARQRSRGSWFWGTLAQAWPIYGEVVLAAVLINLFALASPLFIMNVYDRVVPNHAIETLWVLAVGVLTVFLFDFLLRNLRGYFVDSAGRIADVKLASRIFEQVLGIQHGGAAGLRRRVRQQSARVREPARLLHLGDPGDAGRPAVRAAVHRDRLAGSAAPSPWCRRSRCPW